MGIQTVSQALANEGPAFSFKNKIINGNFEFWQRANTFTQTIASTSGSYMVCDRYFTYTDTSSTRVISRQEFTTNERNSTEPAKNSQYYHRVALTPSGSTTFQFYQRIEGLRQFANKTVTVSFYAKADRAQTTNLFLYGVSGGGSEDFLTSTQSYTLGTSWQKYTFTLAIPTINTGWSFGATEALTVYLTQMTTSTAITIDFSQVQFEIGSVATPFELRPSTQELMLCMRYFQSYKYSGFISGPLTANAHRTTIPYLLVPMRAAPTLTFYDMNGNSGYLTEFSSQTQRAVQTWSSNGTAGYLGGGYVQTTTNFVNAAEVRFDAVSEI